MDHSKRLRIVLFSFGFKYGPPVGVNMLWDVRFLPNPYWVEQLRALTGKVPEVADYVLKSSAGEEFAGHLQPLLRFLVEQHREAGKKSVRLAIGCTGGRHRSVAVTEMVAEFLRALPVELTVFHRDIERDQPTPRL